MEGNLSTGNMMPRASYGGKNLQGSVHVQHQQHPHVALQHHGHPHQQQQLLQEQQSQQQRQQQQQQQQQAQQSLQCGVMIHPSMHVAFPQSAGHMHDSNQQQGLHMMVDYGKREHGKNSATEENETGRNCVHSHDALNEGNKVTPWQRMKWTDAMVRLLITVVSYIGEDTASECQSGLKRKFSISQKKGKWKCVSKVIAERGCYISPQQCEDKLNDLNKRYKRLNDILGRGTSCKVVENPALLDLMDLPEKAKDEVRKILSSKQLFYEEMCSYHNSNRLHLPADPSIQRSLLLALRSSDEHDIRSTSQDDIEEDDQGAETDGRDDEEEDDDNLHGDNGAAGSCFPKRMKLSLAVEGSGYANNSGYKGCDRRPHPQGISLDMSQVSPEGSKTAQLQMQMMRSRALQLQEEQLQIQLQMLELEMQRAKWQRFNRKKDRELEKLRLENEKMKFENKRLALELKHKQFEKGSYSI